MASGGGLRELTKQIMRTKKGRLASALFHKILVWLDSRLERLNQVCFLPREPTVGLRRAPKMPVGSRALENRFVQAQMCANATWGEIHAFRNSRHNLTFMHLARAMGIGVDR